MEFLSTWQFWVGFTIGLFAGAIVGYFVAALCAVSSRASRQEERMEDERIFEAAKRERKRRGLPETEIVTKNNLGTD